MPNNKSFDFAWLLRFRPSSAPESQIMIVKQSSGLAIIESTSLDGNIYSQLNEILNCTGREDARKWQKQSVSKNEL